MDEIKIIVKSPIAVPVADEPHAMLLKCPIDGEEYWSDRECPRTAIHEKILSQ